MVTEKFDIINASQCHFIAVRNLNYMLIFFIFLYFFVLKLEDLKVLTSFIAFHRHFCLRKLYFIYSFKKKKNINILVICLEVFIFKIKFCSIN